VLPAPDGAVDVALTATVVVKDKEEEKKKLLRRVTICW
jgi:hypothetical protein